MIRALSCAWAALLLGGLAHGRAETTVGLPPNVLVIVVDDVGVDAVGAYAEGTSIPSTPNLDSLAAGGLLFRNAWSSPVCSATRATLLTGRYGFRTGVGWLVFQTLFGPPLPLSEWTIPELLDLGTQGQYAHAAIGKWHLGNTDVGGNLAPNLAGFSHFSGTLANLGGGFDYFTWPKIVNGATSVSTVYATTDTVNSALNWIQATPEPWFCYVAFNAAHTPFHDPPAELHGVDLSMPTDRLRFEAMVEALDTEIGRLLTSLDPQTVANTMVILVGDNGSHEKITLPPFDPDHAKATLYEGGINVPLLVSGPLVSSPGSEVASVVSTTDVCATVLEIAGVQPASLPTGAAVDSVSFAPYFADPARTPLRSTVYAESFRPNGPKERPPYVKLLSFGSMPVCQDDVGFAGPGSTTLSVCGPPLFGGYLDGDLKAQLRLEDAPPNAPGLLYVGYVYDPTPLFGGIVVPGLNAQVSMFTTSETGTFTASVAADTDFVGLRYYQALVRDLGLPGGYAFSNAVAVETLPTDMETVRDARYKLILDNNTSEEAFFDLQLDPFEQTNLLDAPLAPAQAQAYQALRKELFALRAPVSLRTGR